MKSATGYKTSLLVVTTFTRVLIGLALPISALSQAIDTVATKGQINEERFIKINGIEQWVTIKGDKTKPVILFVHGGPGSTMSPYTDATYKGWGKDFILVQWDQRGAGKTFGHTAPPELSPAYLQANPLTVDQIVNDGTALTQYLTKYLGKQKVILFGTSWGSIIAAEMAVKRPDLYKAYVGHSQVVEPAADLIKAYYKVYQLAQQASDQPSLEVLKSLGPPLYARAKTAGQLLHVIKKYEKLASTPAPDYWWKPSPLYDNPTDNQNREEGDDYSFVNYMGDSQLGVKPMNITVNLLKGYTVFKVPVYLIQGEVDILTPKETSKAYFDKIDAPLKQFTLLPKTAHGFNEAVVKEQFKLFKLIGSKKDK
jgi:pimeloyl-ACP methyl ester carboxylesterase